MTARPRPASLRNVAFLVLAAVFFAVLWRTLRRVFGRAFGRVEAATPEA